MERFIRHKINQTFLRRDGSWTSDPAQAVAFPDIDSARMAVQLYHLANVELVYLVGHKPSPDDVTLPLADAQPLTPNPDTNRARRTA